MENMWDRDDWTFDRNVKLTLEISVPDQVMEWYESLEMHEDDAVLLFFDWVEENLSALDYHTPAIREMAEVVKS